MLASSWSDADWKLKNSFQLKPYDALMFMDASASYKNSFTCKNDPMLTLS